MASLSFAVNPVLTEMAGNLVREGNGLAVRALRAALADALQYWHRNLLMRHFEPSAYARYAGAYTRRTSRYSRAPQVKSGTHKRTLLNGTLRIKPDSGTGRTIAATAALPYSRVANFWQGRRVTRKGLAHNFPRELRAMSLDEIALIDALLEQRVAVHLQEALGRGARALQPLAVQQLFSAA